MERAIHPQRERTLRTRWTRRTASALMLLLLTTLCVAPASAEDWPDWRGIHRDGKSTETGLLKAWPEGGPELLWKTTGLGQGFSSVTVANGTIYTTGDVGNDLTIFALDDKGQLKWKVVQGPAFAASNPGSRSTPVIDGERLYLIGGPGLITCHRTTDGQEIWRREMKEFGGSYAPDGYTESVLIVDDLAIVTPGNKTAVVALDKLTGKDRWRSDAEGVAHFASAIVLREQGSTIIIQATGTRLVALDARDGKKLWSDDFCKGGASCCDPAYADGYLFWAHGQGKKTGSICFKVDFKDGQWAFTEAWRNKEMVCEHGGYVIHEGHVYGNHNDGWACLDLKTGVPKWTRQKGIGKGSICFADGMLYFFSEKGGRAGLAPASPEGLTLTGQAQVEGVDPSFAHPVVANGRLYLRYGPNLYCLDVKAK